jgi:hypothetical protein
VIVVVPYIEGRLRDEVIDGLHELPPRVAVVPWELRDAELGYGRMLRSMWHQLAGREGLMIIEQDVVVPVGGIRQMEECPLPWCSHSYAVYWGDVATMYGGPFALGCTRFSAELMAAEPDVVDVALTRPEHGDDPPGHWLGLDSAVSGVLRSRGVSCHQHFPNAVHLHEYHREGAYTGG